ncbi:Elicitor peptide 2 [Arabidopsis thaliana]
MEKLDKQREQKTYLWIPVQFLDQALIAVLKCIGLLCQPAKKTAPSPVTFNQPEEQEEDYGVAMKDDDVVVLLRDNKAKSKKRDKEKPSSGRPGQTNSIPNAAIQVYKED